MSVKKIHLFPSEESYVTNSGSVEADDLALVPLNLSLNDLSDRPKAYITKTWKSTDGTSWYRKWSDGWIEQGGYNNGDSNYGTSTVTLSTPFTKINYSVFLQCEIGSWDYGSRVSSRTTSTFTTETRFSRNFRWYACGY